MTFGVGPRSGEAIVKHQYVPLISFTGSTATGQFIQRESALYVKRLSLEVGRIERAILSLKELPLTLSPLHPSSPPPPPSLSSLSPFSLIHSLSLSLPPSFPLSFAVARW